MSKERIKNNASTTMIRRFLKVKKVYNLSFPCFRSFMYKKFKFQFFYVRYFCLSRLHLLKFKFSLPEILKSSFCLGHSN